MRWPQLARATVNCRIMPGEPVDESQATLVRVLAVIRLQLNKSGRRS